MYKKIYIIILIFLNIFQIKTATIAKIDENNSEIKYNNQHYLNSYKIPSTMALYKSNGKFYDEHPLRYAFDGNFSTYWESINPQEDSFLNNIEIIFSKTILFDRIIYQAPTINEIEGEGYPTELRIYCKLNNQDKITSDYLLIDDIISERTGEKVVFDFVEAIYCDQIKLEWCEIERTNYTSDNVYAMASEIMVLLPENEYLNKLLFKVFDENDYSKTIINPEYNDLLAIQEIEENLQDYLYSYK